MSYAFQDLPRRTVVKYARQYEGVDMARLIGADEENIPFLIATPDGDEWVICWNAYHGLMAQLDEDPVRAYATARYLRENAYPVFTSPEEAERYALEHHWPRKPLPDSPSG